MLGSLRHALSRLLPSSSKTAAASASPTSLSVFARTMATKKSGGTGGVTRTSNPKYLGLKVYGDQFAKAGSIIMRQRGLKYRPGENVGIGRDFTLYAKKAGWVEFMHRRLPKPTSWIHVREGTREEHMARVAKRVEMRKTPRRVGVWEQLQAGAYAERGAPPPP